MSPVDGPYTSNSEIWPAGHAVLAVMFSRRYRAVVAVKLIVTVLLDAGSNRYPAEATMSVKLLPVVLPCTASVSVRAPQPETGSLEDHLADADR